MNGTRLTIDIVSDVACPWCAIGFKRLERAMQEVGPGIDCSIHWRAFQLNPDMPPEGEPILEHLTRKYGRTPREMRAAQRHIMNLAAELGLNFAKAQERRAWNTFDAHRLLAWAREQGQQTALKLALFDAYFGHARNLSDHEVLTEAATGVGLPGEEARAVLRSDRYAELVRTEELRYKQAGITGVPAFVINHRHLVSGAQEPETLVAALRDIATATSQDR